MRKRHKILLVIADVCAVLLAVALAHLSTHTPKIWTLKTAFWAGGNVICTVGLFTLFGMYSIVFKSVGIVENLKLLSATAILGVFNVVYSVAIGRVDVSIGTAFIFTVLLAVMAVGIRYMLRIAMVLKYYFFDKRPNKTRVMIVGGGDAGTMLIKEMLSSDKVAYYPVCIVDDSLEKVGKAIGSVKVVGTTEQIPELVEKYHVQEIFIAMPSVAKRRLSEIVNVCKDAIKTVKILPGVYQFATGEVTVATLRDVDVQDLLGREQVKVNLDEIMGYIEHETVLVTGGGGSIGSELCRQVASHNPKTLIIFDIYENNAYDIEQELKHNYPNLKLITLIGSIRDEKKIRNVFEKYQPRIVFHAAAHKHVPLMETSPNEAVKNNVFGTLNVARMADEFKVKTFVQISTDKAVNPTNIMGATKRICEMIIQTIGRHSKHTNFVAVRFGNVLGSNGSVIPLFRKQIAAGGPVTVTDKEIIRYFMTIPEAVSLVLQAGAYAKGGQIFVLDMGEPVKIYDLAYNLIKLSGYKPNEDIDIVCTGLRPGEKLYEERLMEEEGLQTTANGLINIARPIPLDEDLLWKTLDKLHVEVHKETEEMKSLVQELVPTYTIDETH
ncbi:MAG: polysaccharide biosynthesis protein [Clostridia bacterium]|nr:polysaccharide biosynthesis protein [Clostridia bacterium]